MPGLRVMIPDMVYFEVTQDLAKTGAEDIVQWSRKHQGQVELVPTSVFSEFQIIRFADERTRSKGRGEQAALEVLTAEIDKDPDLEAILLFEDNDVKRRRFVLGVPERVMALSTGDLLRIGSCRPDSIERPRLGRGGFQRAQCRAPARSAIRRERAITVAASSAEPQHYARGSSQGLECVSQLLNQRG